MLDPFDRTINYLRISVTDRCNMRCVYCMPPEGVKMLTHSDILRFNEIIEVIQVAVNLGVDKIRFTGGEPLVRKGIVDLVSETASIPGIKDLSMTTNALLLEQYAGDLKDAGLHRVNISLDTLDIDRYREITRGGDLKQVLHGIEAAEKAGLTPIKLNCVIRKSHYEEDALMVRRFGDQKGYQVRFIHLMDLDKGYFKPVEGGEGGNCVTCNRLRLTADGKIKPCLFNDLSFSVRELGARQAILRALKYKPANGQASSANEFYNIGG